MDEGHNVINVTKTYLPPLEDYVPYLERIWASHRVTNNGPLAKELEDQLKHYLNVKHLFFVSNGTIALQIAIKALDLRGEIITTPFSYVATTSSIVWAGCQPVFVDVDPHTLCLNPALIEAAITCRTSAILPVHVYGHPCDVESIQAIARRHGLKVIYDAAHGFGVRRGGRSLLVHGDVATLSFHATKVFHTVEGGALVTQDDGVAHRIAYMRNFGHRGQEGFWGLGVNGKSSELHAAMGLCVLPKVAKLIHRRRAICALYDRLLAGTGLGRPRVDRGVAYNYAYYPTIFPSEAQLLVAREILRARGIFPRRYFYPSLNQLDYVVRRPAPVADDIARRVLCLPLSHALEPRSVVQIAGVLSAVMGTSPSRTARHPVAAGRN